jgi:phage terminase small subunit
MTVVSIKARRDALKPPPHLKPDTQAWFAHVVENFELEQHHLKLLTLAGEAWDRCQAARQVLDSEGMTYCDRFGAPRARPEAAIERDSRIAFSRILRELDLDLEPPPPPSGRRPPSLRSNRRA